MSKKILKEEEIIISDFFKMLKELEQRSQFISANVSYESKIILISNFLLVKAQKDVAKKMNEANELMNEFIEKLKNRGL